MQQHQIIKVHSATIQLQIHLQIQTQRYTVVLDGNVDAVDTHYTYIQMYI